MNTVRIAASMVEIGIMMVIALCLFGAMIWAAFRVGRRIGRRTKSTADPQDSGAPPPDSSMDTKEKRNDIT